MLLVVWVVISVVSLVYNAKKSVSEIKEWAPLSDSEKRNKIFGDSHTFFIFIANHTDNKSHILIFSQDVKTFYLSKYYLYPRIVDSTDNYNDLKHIARKGVYSYIALEKNTLSLDNYSIVASNSGKFYLYKKNE
jgi:hypothetical protein